jgi:acetyl esterase/lipase
LTTVLLLILLASLSTHAREHKDLEYAKVGSTTLLLDLYTPDDPGPFPTIIWIHGGGWDSGDKSDVPILSELGRGYAVASINYRLSGEATFPAQVFDCKAAVRFLRAHAKEFNLNSDEIAAWGQSAGGHLAVLLGTTAHVAALEGDEGNLAYPSCVQAVVDFSGPVDFLTEDADALSCSEFCHSCSDSIESKLLGCAVATCPDAARAASPLTYITSDDAPTFIAHGVDDCVIPPAQSRRLFDALQSAGVPSAFVPVADTGHTSPVFFDETTISGMADLFLDIHLQPNGDAPLLLADPSGAALALDAQTHVAGPFALTNPLYFGADKRTRVELFAYNLGPYALSADGISARAVDTDGVSRPLLVEYAAPMPDVLFTKQLVIPLPDELKGKDKVRVFLTVAGQQETNGAWLTLKP